MIPSYIDMPLHTLTATLNHLGIWAYVAVIVATFTFGLVCGIAFTLYRIQRSQQLKTSSTAPVLPAHVVWLPGYHQQSLRKKALTKHSSRSK